MWNLVLQKISFFSGNEAVTLFIGLIVLVILRFIQQYRKSRKLPPGPIGFPILGYYPFLRKNPEKVLTDLSKKFGNVIGLYIGSQYTVILNDWEAVKDALGQSTTTDRPASLFADIPYNLGFSAANGAEWIQTRRLTAKAMKDTGMHSTRWEELIQEEVLELADRIKQEGQRPLELRSYFAESFTNSILTLVMGERFPSGHPLTKTASNGVSAILEFSPTLGMANFSTTLSKMLQTIGLEQKFSMYDNVRKFCYTIGNIVEEKLRNLRTESSESFFVRLKEGIENHHKNQENIRITDDNQKGTVITLLSGGSHTVRASTIWVLIALADYPEIQQNVHEELDKVIGKEDSFSWSQRDKIPYTYAVLLESMRWRTLGYFPALRKVIEDTKIQGYDIPKGTFLTTNNWALHNDPRYWKNPELFLPERFIEGTKVNPSPESYNPFSYGKRNCPGKLIALMENLQYLVILMQKFQVIPKEGDKVKYDIINGLAHEATNVELRFIPR